MCFVSMCMPSRMGSAMNEFEFEFEFEYIRKYSRRRTLARVQQIITRALCKI